MLVIRLFRIGKKNQPSFKIVVTEKTRPSRAGRFVEEVGFYNPLTKEKILKQERIKYWLSVGAKPSDTLFNLLISEKIIEGKKAPIYMKKIKKEEPASAPAGATASQGEKPAEAAAAKEEKPKEEAPKEEKEKAVEKPASEPPKTQ